MADFTSFLSSAKVLGTPSITPRGNISLAPPADNRGSSCLLRNSSWDRCREYFRTKCYFSDTTIWFYKKNKNRRWNWRLCCRKRSASWAEEIFVVDRCPIPCAEAQILRPEILSKQQLHKIVKQNGKLLKPSASKFTETFVCSGSCETKTRRKNGAHRQFPCEEMVCLTTSGGWKSCCKTEKQSHMLNRKKFVLRLINVFGWDVPSRAFYARTRMRKR